MSEDALQQGRQLRAEAAPVTARSFERQLQDLALRKQDLKGKCILVLGPGMDFDFEKGAKRAGAELVVALSWKPPRTNSVDNDPVIKPIKALFQQPPPAYNTFDRIVSVQGFPRYAYDRMDRYSMAEMTSDESTQLRNNFSDILDLLAVGGEARFSPVVEVEIDIAKALAEDSQGKFKVRIKPTAKDLPSYLLIISREK